jgi:hypothetical protein
MDPQHGHAGLEEVERFPSDESDLKSDAEGVHDEHRVSNTDVARHSSATNSNLEKREDVEIVDWDGPNDPENPYARLDTTCSRRNRKTDGRLVSTGLHHGNGFSH